MIKSTGLYSWTYRCKTLFVINHNRSYLMNGLGEELINKLIESTPYISSDGQLTNDHYALAFIQRELQELMQQQYDTDARIIFEGTADIMDRYKVDWRYSIDFDTMKMTIIGPYDHPLLVLGLWTLQEDYETFQRSHCMLTIEDEALNKFLDTICIDID